MEEKSMLVHLLRKYRIVPGDGGVEVGAFISIFS
jgi:hypothetical protein